MLENFENTVNDANANMIDNAESLKDKMVGTNGILTQIGSSADTIANSMTSAATATDTLTTATDNLFTLFTSDDKNFKAALTKIKNYEKQLKNTQTTTSTLRPSRSPVGPAVENFYAPHSRQTDGKGLPQRRVHSCLLLDAVGSPGRRAPLLLERQLLRIQFVRGAFLHARQPRSGRADPGVPAQGLEKCHRPDDELGLFRRGAFPVAIR